MRASLAVSAAAFFSTALAAQNAMNEYLKYDANVEYTSRGHNGGNPGFVSQAFAYGFTANLRTLTRIRYWIQDQNAQTQERWNVGFTTVDAAGEPDYPKSVMYATNLVNPPNTGIRAWQITHTPTTPLKAPATTEQWHHVLQILQPATIWADGLGTWVSWGGNYYNTMLCNNQSGGWRHREIPRLEGNPPLPLQEEFGWSARIGRNPGIYNDCSWALRLFFEEPVLNGAADNVTYNVSCLNPNPGYMSLDPDFADNGASTPGRFDDFAWNVAAGPRYAGGVAVMFFSQVVLPGGGVNLPGLGQLHIDPVDPLMLGPLVFPGLDANGTASFPLKFGPPNGGLRNLAATFPSWSAQAVVIKSGAPTQLTNLYTFRALLEPKGFTAATAVKGTPASIPHTPSQTTIFIRNDGRGVLTVQPMRGSQKIGPAFTVRDRSASRLPAHPAASTIEVSSNFTTPTKFVWAYNR